MVSTHLKNISQIGNLPQVRMKLKNIWNRHLVIYSLKKSNILYLKNHLKMKRNRVPSQFSAVCKSESQSLGWSEEFSQELCLDSTITGRSHLCLLRMVRWIGELWSPSSWNNIRSVGWKAKLEWWMPRLRWLIGQPKKIAKKKSEDHMRHAYIQTYARIRIPNDMQNVSEYITHSIYCISKQIYLLSL